MIEGFKERLDTWLVAAGRELHQELIDVLGRKAAVIDDPEQVVVEAVAAEREPSLLTGTLTHDDNRIRFVG